MRRTKNWKLLERLSELRLTQSELVRSAGLSSEAKLSRIIKYTKMPTSNEIGSICAVLGKNPIELGLDNESFFKKTEEINANR